ncbi:MAG: Hint domain-containing protein [Rhodobacteraceae bacterium]|nr:Hint domain-containing protein [Paracoccaceae bacterium]
MNPDNLRVNGNGLSIDPSTITGITWRDAKGDDRIADSDTDDVSRGTNDRVIVNGTSHVVREIANYNDGSMVFNGTPYTVSLAVWLLDDGSYLVRLADTQIPIDGHYSHVESLTLGTFDGVEYSHSRVSTRDEAFLCFVAGTLIHTAQGLIAVENIEPGDLVLTVDHGFCPVRWIARRKVPGQGAAAPVLISAGTLGNSRDLLLSQQHRVLLSGWRAEMLFGVSETLAAAVHLVNGTTIRLMPCASVDYVHLLFDTHELVFSEGIATESYHPNAYALSVLTDSTRAEVMTLFPELQQDPAAFGSTARPCLRAWEAWALLGT